MGQHWVYTLPEVIHAEESEPQMETGIGSRDEEDKKAVSSCYLQEPARVTNI